MNEILKKYPTPANCTALQVPKCNPPIWEGLKPNARSMDVKLQKVEKLLVTGLTALSTVEVSPLTEDRENAYACLAAAVFELNMTRRDLLKPGLSERYTQLCKPSIPVTSMLFGDDLSQNIRDLSEIHRATGKLARYQPYTRGRGYNRARGTRPFLGGRGFSSQHRFKQSGKPQLSARGRGRGGASSRKGQ